MSEQPQSDDGRAGAEQNPNLEQLWQFSGHRLSSSEFNTAMVHFYRAEISRANVWRSRLDMTTNWAVITAGAALSFTFGSAANSPVVIIIDTMLVMMFLFIEARRYRYYELWASRVRILENNYFAGLLSPPFLPQADWADRLTESLRHPRFPISLREALGRRYRRNYAPIFLLLSLSYIVKIMIHPTPYRDLPMLLGRAAIGPLPGWAVLAVGFVVNAALIATGVFTVGLRQATGEVLPEMDSGRLAAIGRRLRRATWEVLETDVHLPPLPFVDRRKQMAYIISDRVDVIGPAVIEQLGRGVTLMHGTGMYTGEEHGVLMCVFNVDQARRLKRMVYEYDPKAFVIITPVQDVRGFGFRPLEA